MADKFEQYQKAEFDRFFSVLEIPDNRALRIEFETLLRFMGDLRGKRVLDLGCGTGRNGLQLARHAGEVVGYDLSEVAIEKANADARRLGLTNFHAEVNNFAHVEEASFDVVLEVNMLHHASAPREVAKQVRRALRPGGEFVMFENNPLNPLFPFFFVMIGQLRSHLTKQYLMVNRFTLARMLADAGLELSDLRRHGYLPTALYNYSLAFKALNESLNRVPVVNELTAFYLIKAVKPAA
jgi:2-polyprenyl-3-methyl-5-hydroxy-6-metoxy-1,4-benzoquinol methylase